MASCRIALIHAVTFARDPVADAFSRLWPDAETVHLTDESLGEDLARAGALTPDFTARMAHLARYAVECGADGVLFTCSAFGAAIEEARNGLPVPVLKPDEAMIDEALSAGPRIGGLATFAPTIGSLGAEIEAAAARRGLTPKIDLRHVPGALDALRADRAGEHDALIARAAEDLADCDALVLAQFSMARAATAVAGLPRRRVLTSPDAAVRRLRSLIAA